ncbi:MAG: anti-sigma factor [Chloroflexi bacterium OHK40]
MNHHTHDSAESQIGAYALGALDPEDRAAVEALLATSPEHQEELRQLREAIALLPYAAQPVTPPERVRERLFARIEASRATAPVVRPQAAVRPRLRWLMPALTAVLATVVLAFGGLTLSLSSAVARLEATNRELVSTLGVLQQALADTQARQETLAAQLAEGQRQLSSVNEQLAASEERITQLRAELAQDEYVISFVSAPGVATRQLTASRTDISAQGEMYMYPGESSAVVLFSGLPVLQPGQVYQFWLADGQTQVAGGTFVVDATGIGHIVVQAPREVNAFSEVMVTIEPAGGSTTPSAEVVLEGSL